MEYFNTEEVNSYITKKPTLYLFFKRVIDITVSIIALVGISPIFLIILIANICCKGNRGPLLYKQVRIGLNGKKFGMYKFRSMIVNAETRLLEDKELYKKYVANNYKLKPEHDPRITCLGRLLRKTSVDELPQFINILKGHMSLIGPRPVIEAELKEYDREKLLSVKPGAMGLWQASGRCNVGYPERANIEMEYIDKACAKLDFKIMIGNLISVFKCRGAY
ncbi:sugar transferase [Companilactobacillus mishanensis]|uniref:Sugar transferase n=1 Tax=Companilactobacillus mishanensis TaxID=2486008 RepID=A0ABW9P968_9LACO|nr:sugar transferase [Companilactobacillus mishanensis]MQS45427.1 sugar transferase [Companilactobacillus mishanensis]